MFLTTFLCVAGTLLAYQCVLRLYLRYRHPLINVVGVSAAVIIAALLLCGLPYSAYEPARKLMTSLIGAATVSLALPPVPLQKTALAQCPGHSRQRQRRGPCGHVFRRAHGSGGRIAASGRHVHPCQRGFHSFCGGNCRHL